MQIKETHIGQVLSVRRRLMISEVGPASVDSCRIIQDIIDKSNLHVTGPWHFVADNLPQDNHTEFEIEFCLPVAGECDEFLNDDVQARELTRFQCASAVYEGPLEHLFEKGYQPLVKAIRDQEHSLTGESREVYHTWCGPDSDKNVVEIQFGVQ
ncbi:hypothetical protein [Photobacterium galatheae]|uniref:Bacterial transcription activator effector binding domain-containing protein n=1 Tax=Photobacterium galatheae TaxID=1654360 RepID=A0A066RQ36_9GAMM|nr:hypothetical protein [Photobacterium galatheae]KDM89787.1 hypothetical protein EA58_20255 [Photobacterium galatheae]MCM0151438.1 hypothetical protein [Photobacterium galatheae]